MFEGGLTGTIKNLASFLACPMGSLLDDLKNAYKSIKDTIKSINPKELLNKAKQKLVEGIKSLVPNVDSIKEFASNIVAYVKSYVGDLKNGIKELKKLLKGMGIIKKGNKLDKNVYDALNAYGDAAVASFLLNVESENLSINLDNEITKMLSILNNKVDMKENNTIKCSALAKIMDRLSNSFRDRNLLDVVRIDPNQLIDNGLRGSDVKEFLNDLRFNKSRKEAAEFNILSDRLGYQIDTSLAGNFTYMIESKFLLEEISEFIRLMENDPISIRNALNNIQNNERKLLALSRENDKRIAIVEEGLHHLKQRQSNYQLDEALERVS